MTEKQKEYIEHNIDLIEAGEWEEFFRLAPWGTGWTLHRADVDFLSHVSSVTNSMFGGTDVDSIVLPDNIKKIDDGAFSNCSSLESIVIPDSVKIIDQLAFTFCTSLKDITIPDSVVTIGEEAFYCSGLTNITLPKHLTRIGHHMFYDCSNLETITIPHGVTHIGRFAFYGCNNLHTVVYQGTKDEWNSIVKASGWASNVGSYTVRCTDGDLSKYGYVI